MESRATPHSPGPTSRTATPSGVSIAFGSDHSAGAGRASHRTMRSSSTASNSSVRKYARLFAREQLRRDVLAERLRHHLLDDVVDRLLLVIAAEDEADAHAGRAI